MNGRNGSAPYSIDFRRKEMFCSSSSPKDRKYFLYTFGVYTNDAFRFSFPLLMVQIILITTTSRFINFLLRPFHQLRIVGDIITGFLLGPEFLGRVLPGYRTFLFPDRVMMTSHTIAAAGVMLYTFLASVKMDPMMVVRSGRKALIIGLFNTLLLLLFMMLAVLPLRSHIPVAMAHSDFFIFLVSPVIIADFPVIADALTDLKLLNSELGRLALSSSMVNSAVGWVQITLFVFLTQSRGGLDKGFKMLFAVLAMVALILFVFRRWMRWIVRRTPKGQRVGEGHIFAILMCVVGTALFSEVVGASNLNGMVVLGLVVPEGPPLGAALVERIELLSKEVMMPLFFAIAGRYVRPEALVHWRSWVALMGLLGLAYVAKIVWTFVPAAYYCQMPARKAFVLALIFSFRGLMNLIYYYRFRVISLIDDESFSIIVLSFLLVTAIVSPAVVKLYNPSAENRHTNHRTIQHLKPNAQLRLLACVQNEEPIPCIINLLEVSSAATAAPLFACVLHMDEQLGRSDSALIAHKSGDGYVNLANMDRLHNAFIGYEKSKNGTVEVWPYTSISPFHNMSEEISALAAQENVAFVVVPVSRRSKINGGLVGDHALRSGIPQLLAQAPCSVGILIHKGLDEAWFNSPSRFQQHIGVLFWSGPDYREALAYASRMARQAGVRLTVTRLLPASKEAQDRAQASLDDQLMAAFQSENAGNDRVAVQQIVVEDMEHAISVIRSVGRGGYDLIVVGRRLGWSSPVLEGLEEWCESPELGVVGDVLASSEFDRCCSILIVQQKT